MLLPANLLRAVNHNSVNQFIHSGSVKLLQIRIPVGKLEETPYIGDLSASFSISLSNEIARR